MKLEIDSGRTLVIIDHVFLNGNGQWSVYSVHIACTGMYVLYCTCTGVITGCHKLQGPVTLGGLHKIK